MNGEQVEKIIEDAYDYPGEDTIWSMAKDFYNRKMLPFIIFIWVWAVIFIAGAVYCGIRFFEVERTQYQIMYAAIFVCLVQCMAMIKVFAWQMIHRNNITRKIKRLELRIAELSETVKNK